MISRRLPPLNALRAFEAAARHLSFTQAAEELHVTQAAISHQVKALEDRLGVPLFVRTGRGLTHTPEGEALLPVLTQSFDAMAAAVEQASQAGAARALSVTTMDSFASSWLVPRMRRFRARHPDIDVRISSTDAVVDLRREGFDCAIRYGARDVEPGFEVVWLMEEDLSPVCSPALMEGPHPLLTPDDLRHHTLLHDDMTINWSVWLEAAGVTGVDGEKGPFYEHSHLVLQAAIAGEGVALGRSALVADDLAKGRLVRPFDIALPSNYAYRFVAPPEAMRRPRVVAFRDWLIEEAGIVQAAGS